MRAMSVRGTAKSNCHRKTHQVELDGTGRASWHLTRGDLGPERVREVSRGRRREEARSCGWSEGPKDDYAGPNGRGSAPAQSSEPEGVATAATTQGTAELKDVDHPEGTLEVARGDSRLVDREGA
jgi:hypothetical protein